MLPPNLKQNYRSLSNFVSNNWRNITSAENMKQFETYLNDALPNWEHSGESMLYTCWQNMSNRKIRNGQFIDIHRDSKLHGLLDGSYNECLILWCQPYVITSWFKIANVIYIKRNTEQSVYEVIINRKQSNSKRIHKSTYNRQRNQRNHRQQPQQPQQYVQAFTSPNKFEKLVTEDDEFNPIICENKGNFVEPEVTSVPTSKPDTKDIYNVTLNTVKEITTGIHTILDDVEKDVDKDKETSAEVIGIIENEDTLKVAENLIKAINDIDS